LSQPLTSKTVSELIGCIYDCAVDPAQWSSTLTKLLAELSFKTAAFSVRLYPSGRNLLTYTAGLEPHWLAEARQYESEIPFIWGGPQIYHQLPLDGVHVSTALTTRADLEKLAFVRNWAQPQGLIDKVALILARNSQSLGRLALTRHRDQGPVEKVDIENCQLVLPHLQRAVAICNLLDAQTLAAASFEATFEAIATPIAIVARDLSIIHSNSASERLLIKSPRVGHSPVKLSLPQPMANQALAAAVELGADHEAALGCKGFGIPTNDIDGNPIVVHVLPLNFGHLRRQLTSRAAAAVFFASPTTSPEAPQEALAALYDLTHTEAKVLSLVADGHSRSEIADKLGVALSTIKTHLLRLNSKTGSVRQSELAKLARSLSIPV
jgi:DNA-binding CsgD family transcriptional regulator